MVTATPFSYITAELLPYFMMQDELTVESSCRSLALWCQPNSSQRWFIYHMNDTKVRTKQWLQDLYWWSGMDTLVNSQWQVCQTIHFPNAVRGLFWRSIPAHCIGHCRAISSRTLWLPLRHHHCERVWDIAGLRCCLLHCGVSIRTQNSKSLNMDLLDGLQCVLTVCTVEGKQEYENTLAYEEIKQLL